MKTVWILNHYAQEPSRPGGTRHYALAHGLRRFGWDAYVLAASVELNTGRQRLNAGENHRLERIQEVPFLWIKTPTYTSEYKRVLNMLAYTLGVLLPSFTRELPRPDVVIGSSVHPLAAFSGAIIAWLKKVPFVFEVRDLWPQTLIDMGRLPEGSPITRILRALEKWLYLRAQRIIVLLPRAGDYIVPLGIDPAKIAWIPNGVDLLEFPSAPLPAERETFTIMYFGAHGTANGLDNLLGAMALLKGRPLQRPIRLRLIGNGPLKGALIDAARKLELDNVVFEDPVPKRDIPRLAGEADAFVFNLIDAPVFKYGVSSNKLFDFMAGARPILFCCEAGNNPVQEAGAGITVPPGDPAALADAMHALSSMPLETRRSMGENARRYVDQNHDYMRLAQKLAHLLDEVIVNART